MIEEAKELRYVIHVSTAVKSEEKARAWVSQAYVDQERSQGVGSPSRQGAGEIDRIAEASDQDTAEHREHPLSSVHSLVREVSTQHGSMRSRSAL